MGGGRRCRKALKPPALSSKNGGLEGDDSRLSCVASLSIRLSIVSPKGRTGNSPCQPNGIIPGAGRVEGGIDAPLCLPPGPLPDRLTTETIPAHPRTVGPDRSHDIPPALRLFLCSPVLTACEAPPPEPAEVTPADTAADTDAGDAVVAAAMVSRERTGLVVEYQADAGRINFMLPCDPYAPAAVVAVVPAMRPVFEAAIAANTSAPPVPGRRTDRATATPQ